MCSGQFGPSPHGELPSRVSIRHSGPNSVGASRMAARARTREVLRPDRGLAVEARSPPDQMDCFSSPAPRWLLGSRTVVLLALLVIYNDETTYTYRPSDAVAGRASHVDDARAGRSPWHGGLGEMLPGTLGLRIVHFLPIRPHRRTRLLRLGGAVSAVARQRGVLVRSSSVWRLARVAGHRPQPPGSRLAAPHRQRRSPRSA